MKNKLIDLNDHLFAQLERLSDEGLSPEKIDEEIKRTDAIVKIASQIVDVANVAIDSAKLVAGAGGSYEKFLPMIEGKAEIVAQGSARQIIKQ